jgi:hypothetical protein
MLVYFLSVVRHIPCLQVKYSKLNLICGDLDEEE